MSMACAKPADAPSSAGVPRPENEEAWWVEVQSGRMQDEARQNLINRTVDDRSPKHRQVLLESPWGPEEVDAGMVTILKALWARKVRTFMSCEDNCGNVWIHFELEAFQRFVRKARRSPDLDEFLHYCLVEFLWPFRGEDEEFYDSHEVALRFPCRYKEAFEAFLAAW